MKTTEASLLRTQADAAVAHKAAGPGSVNLADLTPTRALLLWGGFPYVFQAGLLAGLIGLILLGWGLHTPEGVNAKLYAKSNLVTLLVWGLWWPAMVWITVLMGRAWCMVCPLELVSNISERIGRRFGVRQRVLKAWLAGGSMIVLSYALLQLLVTTAQLHRTPAYTSWFLLGLLGLAAVTGLLWKDRAFCRAFCPVGLLLGTYGRGGMLAVRAQSGERCKACSRPDCRRDCNRKRPDARSCPSLLNPSRLSSNRDCLLCGQCVKSCGPQNMQLILRPIFSKSDTREPLASWPVTFFVILVSGFVVWELCTEWKKAEALFLATPQWLISPTSPSATAAGLLKYTWALLVVPCAVWLLLAALLRLLGERHAIPQLLRRMALPLAVVIAAGHMCKGLAKFVSWAPFLPSALRDPDGIRTAQEITARTISAPTALLSSTSVGTVGLVMILTALAFSLREYRLAHPDEPFGARTILPMILVALAFAGLVAGWIQY